MTTELSTALACYMLQVINPQVYEEHYAEQSELLSENRKQVEALEAKIESTQDFDVRLDLLKQKHDLEIYGSRSQLW